MYDDLTIVIPTYNEDLVIEKTIRELLNYNIKNIIVVDGGSQDFTLEIVKKFNIKIIDIGYRSGYGDAFIKGIDATNTNYLCKKLQINRSEFEDLLSCEIHHYSDFKNWDFYYRSLKKVQAIIERLLGKRIKIFS